MFTASFGYVSYKLTEQVMLHMSEHLRIGSVSYKRLTKLCICICKKFLGLGRVSYKRLTKLLKVGRRKKYFSLGSVSYKDL